MKRLLGYLKEHLCVTILAPLFKMLEASFELFVPLVVASMIDVGIGHHDIGLTWNHWIFIFYHSTVFCGKIGCVYRKVNEK